MADGAINQRPGSGLMLDAGAAVVTEDDLRRTFAETFKLEATNVTPDMSPENVDAWDSFGHMRLVTAVEARFAVRLTMEQILAIDSFATLRRILDEARRGE